MIILLCDLLYNEAMSSTFCTIIVQNGISKNCEGISDFLICGFAWPELTDIINILIRCEFPYQVEFGFICEY